MGARRPELKRGNKVIGVRKTGSALGGLGPLRRGGLWSGHKVPNNYGVVGTRVHHTAVSRQKHRPTGTRRPEIKRGNEKPGVMKTASAFSGICPPPPRGPSERSKVPNNYYCAQKDDGRQHQGETPPITPTAPSKLRSFSNLGVLGGKYFMSAKTRAFDAECQGFSACFLRASRGPTPAEPRAIGPRPPVGLLTWPMGGLWPCCSCRRRPYTKSSSRRRTRGVHMPTRRGTGPNDRAECNGPGPWVDQTWQKRTSAQKSLSGFVRTGGRSWQANAGPLVVFRGFRFQVSLSVFRFSFCRTRLRIDFQVSQLRFQVQFSVRFWCPIWATIVGNHLKVISRCFRLSSSGDATHASGRQGVREAEPNGGLGNSTTLDPLVRSDPRGFSCLRP